MSLVLSVSPDFAPEHLSGWFIFNTWLQRNLDCAVHLELYDDFDHQRRDIQLDKIDLIYANPYDAAMLVREKGFTAVAKPKGGSDEAVIAVSARASIDRIEALEAGVRVASTHDPDVNMMGMIMLEPADLDRSNIERVPVHSYVLVAKSLLNQKADVGFFLKAAFDDLSELIRNQLRVLVQSQIDVIHHVLLAGPALQDKLPQLRTQLLTMSADPKGAKVLESMQLAGWEMMDEESTEFMIDLIDTLLD